jgi:hypothetical protein
MNIVAFHKKLHLSKITTKAVSQKLCLASTSRVSQSLLTKITKDAVSLIGSTKTFAGLVLPLFALVSHVQAAPVFSES